MTDKKFEARLAGLTAWAADVSARGFVPPKLDDLTIIAREKSVNASGLDAALTGAWQAAIKEVLKQVAFNIAEPHRQLGSEFDEPEGAAGRPQPTWVAPSPAVAPGPDSSLPETYEEKAFQSLKAWRDRESAKGRPLISNVKESQLKLVVQSKRTSVEEIQKFMPAVGQFAEEIAQILSSIDVPSSEIPKPSLAAPVIDDPTTQVAQASPSLAAPLRSAVDLQPQQTPPSAAPAPALPRPVAGQSANSHAAALPTDGIDQHAFALFEYGQATSPVGKIAIGKAADGTRRYSWDPCSSDKPITIYRVVSGEDHPPYSPDQAELVTVTNQEMAADGRPARSAVRYVQVWANQGGSAAEAIAAQPVLHAEGAFVSEVHNVEIREDEGRVIGQWTAPPGTRNVQVFRLPTEKAAYASGDPEYRIQTASNNLGGFIDGEAERGREYLYQVYAEAVVGDVARLSSPVVRPVRVSAILRPVTDLAAMEHPQETDVPCFDFQWTVPPGGTVVIHRTELPPDAGLELKPLSTETLNAHGLLEESRLAHPIIVDGGRATMEGVPRPTGWTRAYFTPVTILNGQAHVGTTISKSWRDPVRNPKILERVNSQILTFEWPDGAAAVLVYVGKTGLEPEFAMAGHPHEITEPDYQQRGGLQFGSNLPSEGCDLHMVPVSFEAGKRIAGAPTTITYQKILRLKYQVTAKRSLLGGLSGLTVGVEAINPTPSMPSFVLVYNPKRLPLTVSDGVPVSMMSDLDGGPAPARRFTPSSDGMGLWKTEPEAWQETVSPDGGFVRLFADLPPEILRMVALLDPPMKALRISGAGALNPFRGMFDAR